MGVHGFCEQDDEVGKLWYTRDNTKRLFYNSNVDLCGASAANCRDSFYSVMSPKYPSSVELPAACCIMSFANAQRYCDGIFEATDEIGFFFV
ncbi:hypothetical protein RJ640_010546 [Escallonia rubra]|uniref:Uncharacterized protein n=1 Tax=Escallonia rubra TaxID=112253 RepID=A0AA88U456_9ASTE|nr:hypothetical protein RJ640_010546 [Escallonia rubra]